MVTEHSLVVHSNMITRAAYRLTPYETRIILTAISMVPHDRMPSDEVIYRVTAKDLIALGTNSCHVYGALREAADKLFDRSVVIRENGQIRRFRWVQEVVYEEGDGSIGLRFSKPMLPFLSEIKAAFTKYRLIEIAGLSSEYAIRIYQICAQYRDTGWCSLPLAELRETLEVGQKYSGIGMFRQKVLDTAVKQINASPTAAFNVSYELMKTGRRYTDVKFQIRDRKSTTRKLNLTEKQASTFALKLLLDDKVWMNFYGMARKNGLSLTGVVDKFEAGKKTSSWLLADDHAQLALPYLLQVGFTFKKRRPS